VFINPQRLNTEWSGIVQTHMSNYDYIKTLNIPFTYFVLHASNDMFVRHGCEEYIHASSNGYQLIDTNNDMPWTPRRRSKWDTQFHAMLDDIGCQHDAVYGSQVEGVFFERSVFDEIATIINRRFSTKGIVQVITKDANDSRNTLYAREEIYFASIANALRITQRSLPYVYSEVSTGTLQITPAMISSIIECRIDSCLPRRFGLACNLRDVHDLYDVRHVYAVKRVPRQLNNPLREYIRGLQ
jgi:hypothetical protein